MSNASFKELMDGLYTLANPANVAGMAHFGIHPTSQVLGITIWDLRRLAKGTRDHALALQLWQTNIHEARMLAVFIDDPAAITPEQMDSWAADFDSWDICDQACTSLFDQSPFAWIKAVEWCARDEEFVRRGAFALMAGLAWHDKTSADAQFLQFLPLIRQYSNDGRNFVKKAVSWALRNIGKRRQSICPACISLARELAESTDRSMRWVGKDALKELERRCTQTR